MNKKIVFGAALLGSAAISIELEREAHHNQDAFGKLIAGTPAAESIVFFRMPHGPEPEGPGGPLRMPGGAVVVSTSTSTASVTVMPTTLGPILSLWKGSRSS